MTFHRIFLFFFLVFVAGLSLVAEEPVTAPEDVASFLKLDDLKKAAAGNPKAACYRLTINRSFHPSLIFEIDADAIYVRKVRTITENFERDISSYRLVRNSRMGIDPKEYTSFENFVDAATFWDLPEADWQSPGLDGSEWILEGVKDGKYHRVQRASPFLEEIDKFQGEELGKLSPSRAIAEGRLTAVFSYLWGMSGEAQEELY